jgi:hypothetical protein
MNKLVESFEYEVNRLFEERCSQLSMRLDNSLNIDSELFFDENFMCAQGCLPYSTGSVSGILKPVRELLSKYNVKLYLGHLNSKLIQIGSTGAFPIVIYTNTNLVVKLSALCFYSGSSVYVTFFTNDLQVQFGGSIPPGNNNFQCDTSSWSQHFSKLVKYVDPRIYADFLTGCTPERIQNVLLTKPYEVSILKEEVAQLDTENSDLVQRLATSQHDIDKMRLEIQCLSRTNKSLEALNSKLHQERCEREQLNTQLHKELSDSLHQANEEIKRLQECAESNRETERKVLASFCKEIKEEKETLSQRVSELTDEREKLHEEITKLRRNSLFLDNWGFKR